jgi:hypothetical protein
VKKAISRRELRLKILQELPKYFENTDIVNFQEEFVKGNDDSIEVGIALMQEDGGHLTVILSSVYNIYEKTSDEGIINSFCKELSHKYTSIISSSVKELQDKISKTALVDSICCIALETQNNQSMLENSVYEERGPFSIILRQFIVDSNGYVMMAEIRPEEIEADEELGKMDKHSIIEKAILNTANHFHVEIKSMAQMVANNAVNQLMNDGVISATQELYRSSFDIIVSKLEMELPRIYSLNNGTPFGAVIMFYPGFLADLCKKIKVNTLTIIPRTVDEIFIQADKSEQDVTGVINTIDALWNVNKRNKQLSEKAFIYDASSDTISFNTN